MTASPQVRALNLTVADLDGVLAFYQDLMPDAAASGGTFAGIKYKALIAEDGEVAVCLFEAGEANPLAVSFPTMMVNSVELYLPKVTAQGGKVLVPVNPCPCTGAPFAICDDGNGNQFMIKQPRAR